MKEKIIEKIKNGSLLIEFDVSDIDEEIISLYLSLHKDDFRLLLDIPYQFVTDKMVQYYIDHSRKKKKQRWIRGIPEDFITLDIVQLYFSDWSSLDGIPEKFITEDMAKVYFDRKGSLMYIPEKFITEDMALQYFTFYKKIKFIPEKFITEEMAKYAFEHEKNYDKKLDGIPERLITREMALKFFEKSYLLEKVPSKYRTMDMKKRYCIRTKCISGEVFDEDIYYLIEENMTYRRKLSVLAKRKMYALELEKALLGKRTIPGIIKEYSTNVLALENCIPFVREELQDEVRQLLSDYSSLGEGNANKLYAEQLKFLENLVHSLGDISAKRITIDQKVAFIYNFCLRYPNEDLLTLCNKIIHYSDIQDKELLEFFHFALGLWKQNSSGNSFDAKRVSFFVEKRWFKDCSDVSWTSKTFSLADGSTVTLVQDDVKKVLDLLRGYEIPLKECIVDKAFNFYAKGDKELKEFLHYLDQFLIPDVKKLKKTK